MRSSTICLMLAVCAAGVGIGTGTAIAQSDQIVQVLPPDAIPAIDRPVFEPVAKATGLEPNELTIGLVGTRERRTYSTWQLDRHEIVNDIFEGHPIAVTW